MISYTFETSINCAHRLIKSEDKEVMLHGHTYKIVMDINLAYSMTEYESSIKPNFNIQSFREKLISFVSSIDKVTFLNKEDRIFHSLVYDTNIITFDKDPTVDVIAKYIFDEVSKILEKYKKFRKLEIDSIYLKSITLLEGEDNKVVIEE